MHTTEQRLQALAAAGFHGTVTMSVSDGKVQFTGQLTRYKSYQNEVKAGAAGADAAGAAALGRMLRAAEAYVDEGERIELLPVHLPPLLAEADPTDLRREANRSAAERDNATASDMVDADEELAF